VAETCAQDPRIMQFLEHFVSSFQVTHSAAAQPQPQSPNAPPTAAAGAAAPVLPGTPSRNVFTAADNFSQFYRRDELPRDWSQASYTGGSNVSTAGSEESEGSYNFSYRRESRARARSFAPRGQRDSNWGRYFRDDRSPFPRYRRGSGGNGNRRPYRSRWAPNGADYGRNRHYERFRRQNPTPEPELDNEEENYDPRQMSQDPSRRN